MKRVLFYGNFGIEGENVGSGQTSKTRNFFLLTKKAFPNEKIDYFNTRFFKKNIITNYFKLKKEIKKTDILVIFPGGISNLKFLLRLTKNKPNLQIFYPIVGGWLADSIKNDKKTIKKIIQFSCLYPETQGLLKKLTSLGISNVKLSPIFSLRHKISFEQILKDYFYNKTDKLRLVYFGRLSNEKGIYLAAEAVKKINSVAKKSVCTLDFYGKPQSDFELSKLVSFADENIKYLGFLPDSNVKLIGNYDFFVFPTFYSGEGFPATCVESLMYGTPILASNWAYNSEIVKDGFNGFIFELNGENNLYNLLTKIIYKKYDIISLKKHAYECGFDYLPENAIKPFLEDLKEVL